MKRKEYEHPEFELIEFGENVVITSGMSTGDVLDPNPENWPFQ